LRQKNWKYNIQKHEKSSFKLEIYSDKCLHEDKRKISNNLNLYFKTQGEKEQTKPNISRKEEIRRIRTEIK
jgi:hypothetical protein